MPSVQEIRALQRARRKARRRRTYLFGSLILVTIIGIAVVVYPWIQPGGPPSGASIVYAKLNTSQGLIEIELYGNSAPQTVTNFINLANRGVYTNLVWHRIIADFVVQTGDPNTVHRE